MTSPRGAAGVTSFAEVGIDPATGKRFDSSDRLFQHYLSRQQTGPLELILGWVGEHERACELRGPSAPRSRTTTRPVTVR